MGRPRTPTNVLKLRGSFKKDPARLRERVLEPVDDGGVGDPPEFMGPAAAAVWRELKGNVVEGVLARSDRVILEQLSNLIAQARSDDWVVHPTILIRIEMGLGKLGMTPSDRSKVAVKKGKPVADPIDEFARSG